MSFPDLTAELQASLPDLRGRMEADQPMQDITWFRVGGPAQILFTPADEADLAYVLSASARRSAGRRSSASAPTCWCATAAFPAWWCGSAGAASAGSTAEDGHRIRVGAAVPDMRLAQGAAKAGHFRPRLLSRHPRHGRRRAADECGRAWHRNGGCADRGAGRGPEGRIHTLSLADLAYTYRHCGAPDDLIFTEALYQGAPGDPDEIALAMQEVADYREAHQPTKARTGGSTFKNPPGHSAWKLIDAAGCRGLRVGGAHVSEMHCNFLINDGEASAAGHRNARRDGARPRQGGERHRIGVGNQAPRRAGAGRASPWWRRHEQSMSQACRGADGRLVRRARSVAEFRQGLRRRARRRGLPRHPHRCRPAFARAAARHSRPTSASTPCTARAARTAPSRASWRLLQIPYTHSGVLASALAMNKATDEDRAGRTPASPSPSTASCPASKRRRRTSCRRPMSSSRWRRAPASACSSSARITRIRRSSSPPRTGPSPRR